ncbi:unnamed protein product [Euphydryas editha]|uniref:Uncharacterized protein n=1 Tax=Euphydryas editha TaxID=104508 RepID=A0AAU9TQG6_EUPED|nr:unnamed protein product [Euphydryas editha]
MKFRRQTFMTWMNLASALSTSQRKYLHKRRKKPVNAVTSAERGQHVSIAVCANGAGNFIPPAMIIPRKNYKS